MASFSAASVLGNKKDAILWPSSADITMRLFLQDVNYFLINKIENK